MRINAFEVAKFAGREKVVEANVFTSVTTVDRKTLKNDKNKYAADVHVIPHTLLIGRMREGTFVSTCASLMVIEPTCDAIANMIAIARVRQRCEFQPLIVVMWETEIYFLVSGFPAGRVREFVSSEFRTSFLKFQKGGK